MPPKTAIIIRAKNEEKWIGETLTRLTRQTYRNFEIVVVDSGSTDATIKIIQKFPVRLACIPPEKFTYPYAVNIGCKHAKATEYFVILSAHSLPLSDTWLENGLRHFSNPNVAGVYGGIVALPDGTIWEKLFFTLPEKILSRFSPIETITCVRMGVLGFTNAIIREDLWMRSPIDESYGNGGEDGAWANYWINHGYHIIRDSHFSVAHSHKLGLFGLYRQLKHWQSISKPSPFDRKYIAKYRKWKK